MYYNWVLDKPINSLIETINIFFEENFKVGKMTYEEEDELRRIVTLPEFVNFVHQLNDVSEKSVRIYSWAFKCHYDKVRFYSYILLSSINLIDLYKHPSVIEFILKHVDASVDDVHMCLQNHFTELQFERIRQKRDKLLSATDKYALVDYPFKDNEEKMKWFEYRQILRDLPGSIQDPFTVVFPSSPAPFE